MSTSSFFHSLLNFSQYGCCRMYSFFKFQYSCGTLLVCSPHVEPVPRWVHLTFLCSEGKARSLLLGQNLDLQLVHWILQLCGYSKASSLTSPESGIAAGRIIQNFDWSQPKFLKFQWVHTWCIKDRPFTHCLSKILISASEEQCVNAVLFRNF